MQIITELRAKIDRLFSDLDKTADFMHQSIIESEIRDAQKELALAGKFVTGGTPVDEKHVIGYEPCVATYHPGGEKTYSDTDFKVKLNPDVVTTSEASDPCGGCEECYTNGMPGFCTSPVTVTGYYYNDHRIYGDLETGFYLSVSSM